MIFVSTGEKWERRASTLVNLHWGINKNYIQKQHEILCCC